MWDIDHEVPARTSIGPWTARWGLVLEVGPFVSVAVLVGVTALGANSVSSERESGPDGGGTIGRG